MTDTTSPPADVVLKQVYIFTSKVQHFVDPVAPVLPDVVAARAPALCNVRPYWPGQWLDVLETDKFPICKNCIAVREASQRVG